MLSATFGARLKALREHSGFTQEELATIAGLSVHAVSAIERGHRRRPQPETIRALSAALDLESADRDELVRLARTSDQATYPGRLGEGALPVPPTPLVGRRAEIAALCQWLTDPAARLVTVTGPGGSGKTRVALDVAQAVTSDGRVRARFVPLASIRTPAFVASAIAEALGLSGVAASDLASRARAACDDEPTLLVLDNLEQVLAAAPLLADLLTSVRSLTILATSRAPLRVRGEREFALGPLPVEVAAGEGLAPALQLFIDRARDARPDFQLTAENHDAVAALCRRLDALPLALELAAPWMRVLTPDELCRRLGNDSLLPSAAPRDLPERQQTMNATVAWSYQLLGPSEQEAFRRLGALPGIFSIDAAAAALAGQYAGSESSDWAITVAADLIDKNLLCRADTSAAARPLFRMLETVRAYAALELTASGDRDDVMEGLARYYAAEVERAAHGLMGPDQLVWLDRVRDDLDTYRSLLAWLLEQERADEAALVASCLMFFWVVRGHFVEGLEWYEQVLASPLVSDRAEGQASYAAAVIFYAQGEPGLARAALDRALESAGRGDDAWTAMQAENVLGHVSIADSRLDDAREYFTRALAGFRTVGASGLTANALSGLAWVALATGDTALAERYLDEAEVVVRDAGPWFLTLPLYLRGILAVRRGEADRAIALMRESLQHISLVHDRFVVVYALVPLAAAAVLKEDDEWAARILGARDAITALSGSKVMDPSVADLRDQAERQVRARLGADRWSRAYAAGRRMNIDDVLEDIDARVPALRE